MDWQFLNTDEINLLQISAIFPARSGAEKCLWKVRKMDCVRKFYQEMVSDPEYVDNTEWIPIKPGWRQFDKMH